jgi:hypothetical protein
MPKAKIAESEAAKLGLKYEDHPLIKIVPDAEITPDARVWARYQLSEKMRRNSANPAAN